MSGSTGETPNWTAGYVPSANEWNSWWGRKVDMSNVLFTGAPFLSLSGGFMTGPLHLVDDPISPLQAATKAYADTKLSAVGGDIEGSVTISDQLRAKELFAEDLLYVNKYNGGEWYFSVQPNGDHTETFRAGWYDMWSVLGGVRHWVGNNTDLMTLDADGNLDVLGRIRSDTFATRDVFADSVAVTGGVTATSLGLGGTWKFYESGNFVEEFAPGWANEYTPTNGDRTWFNNNVVVMSLAGDGTFNVLNMIDCGSLAVGGDAAIGGGITAVSGNMAMKSNPTGRLLQVDTNWTWHWTAATGDMTWIGPLPTPFTTFFQMRVSDKACVNFLGGFGGLTDYFVGSDTRLKTDMVPASCGLADILKLEPIEFSRVGVEGPREIGFAAQALREVIPLAVRPFNELDTDDPLLGVTMTPIIVALVNSVKELAAEVAALKAGK